MSSSKNNNTYKKTSFLVGNNSEFINEFYADYLSDPKSIPKSWRQFFQGLSEEQKLILISEFLEQKLRKEQELEFYLKELDELQRKIGYLKQEVSLTNTIINMIKTEKVYDIQENMIEKDKVIKLPERDKDDKK